jgi:hypothetical protein
MDPKGKGMVVNDKEKEPSSTSQGTTSPLTLARVIRRRTGRRRGASRRSSTTTAMNLLLHQETTTILRQRKRRLIKTIPLICIPYNSNAHLLSIPLGKPPHFDGEDYSFWSHKMCSHLFSLHPSIWEIVETGMHFDSTDNLVMINE